MCWSWNPTRPPFKSEERDTSWHRTKLVRFRLPVLVIGPLPVQFGPLEQMARENGSSLSDNSHNNTNNNNTNSNNLLFINAMSNSDRDNVLRSMSGMFADQINRRIARPKKTNTLICLLEITQIIYWQE